MKELFESMVGIEALDKERELLWKGLLRGFYQH